MKQICCILSSKQLMYEYKVKISENELPSLNHILGPPIAINAIVLEEVFCIELFHFNVMYRQLRSTKMHVMRFFIASARLALILHQPHLGLCLCQLQWLLGASSRTHIQHASAPQQQCTLHLGFTISSIWVQSTTGNRNASKWCVTWCLKNTILFLQFVGIYPIRKTTENSVFDE